MRPLGVGLIYLEELDSLFRENNPALSVLELEPEGFWQKILPEGSNGGATYLPNSEAMGRIATLPQHKLIHSVGFPVGGSMTYRDSYVGPLDAAIRKLGASWVSEHLSFNAIETGRAVEQVGFLLPPRQTPAGVDTAVRGIRRLASQLPVPFAFETGVNYLQPGADEMTDGEFFASVAEVADCGILLDLHNLWANERNGRQPVAGVIDALPLDRVWEIHLAGGMMLGEYYLDAHSEAIPRPLLEIASSVLPRLANLGAVVFEIMPGYVSQVGLDRVRDQIALLNALWRLRPAQCVHVERRPAGPAAVPDQASDVVEWERILGTLAVGHLYGPLDGAADRLAQDGGVAIWRTLINEGRDGRIARAMRFTMTLLLRHLGSAVVHQLLRDYHASTFPDLFTSGEADRFADYLGGRLATLPHVPFLAEVLRFEHALVRAALYGARSRVEWEVDPTELFGALEEGRVVSPKRIPRFAMEVVPEG